MPSTQPVPEGRASERTLSSSSQAHNAKAQLTATLQDFAASFDSHPHYAKLWVNWGTSFQEQVWPFYQRFLRGSLKFHRELVAAGLRRGEPLQKVDPDALTYLVIGTATAIVQMKMQKLDPQRIEHYLQMVVELALHQGDEAREPDSEVSSDSKKIRRGAKAKRS